MLSKEQVEPILKILNDVCGANINPEDTGEVNVFMKTNEYRFQGNLGFGGKFYSQTKWYVSCYKEDETPERLAIIERANKALHELQLITPERDNKRGTRSDNDSD